MADIFDTTPRIFRDPRDLQRLFDALLKRGYCIVGPTVRDGAIVYDPIKRTEELPAGWTDEQDGGKYRLKRRADNAYFGYAVGPHSWKKFLHPPVLRLWQATRTENGFEVKRDAPSETQFAFIGVRSCEIHAIAIQDKVFMGGTYVDPEYSRRRKNAFIVALNCSTAGGTCFCVSMKTGPKATFGYDIALTEVVNANEHYLVLQAGSERGAEIVAELHCEPAAPAQCTASEAVVDKTAQSMGRSMDTTGIKELLYRNAENPRWDDLASRCVNCANCTMACPTCFCSTVEDVTDLTGEHAERWRKWDSCFTMDFTHLHGGSVRASGRSRYRHWLTHKIATWIDQFGSSGCVGCGRCITWCPVAIDLTEEVRVLRATDGAIAPSKEQSDAHP